MVKMLVLVHCNVINNDYQQDSRIWHKLVPNISLGKLVNLSPHTLILLKMFNSD